MLLKNATREGGDKSVVLFSYEHEGIAIVLRAFSLAKQIRLLLHNPLLLPCRVQGADRLLPFTGFVFSFSSSSFSELSELLTGSGTLIFSGMAASSSLTFLLLEFEGVLREQILCQKGKRRTSWNTCSIHSQARLKPEDKHSEVSPKAAKTFELGCTDQKEVKVRLQTDLWKKVPGPGEDVVKEREGKGRRQSLNS